MLSFPDNVKGRVIGDQIGFDSVRPAVYSADVLSYDLDQFFYRFFLK